MSVRTVVVLYGPKAAGKSQVADVLRRQHGIAHVDADTIVLDLLAAGIRPDPEDGWLVHIEQVLRQALELHEVVSVEATGAWASDWQLLDDLEAANIGVLSVWVCAPLDLTLRRLAARNDPKVPVTSDEARWIWAEATQRARHRRFDLRLNTGELEEADLLRALVPLVALLEQAGANVPGLP
jgi:shikimate kinase